MGKLNSFTFITLDGYYKGAGNDISWHPHGGDAAEYAAQKSKGENTLVFGRVTYEMMAGFWPTPMAKESFPEVAEGMNKAEKIVFSRTLTNASWEKTRIIRNDIVGEMKHLKKTSEKDMTILGSGSILAQFASHGLVDSFIIMMNPVAIGKGTPIFQNIEKQLNLKLQEHQVFKSGIIVMTYVPA
ncbi:dihydrofolate reductase family protein [Chitinophagaceae bacterium 26-R-25]|nr:dihydrofolate reductase family protein [Chitinophagaceae bacterium 26-R-25]